MDYEELSLEDLRKECQARDIAFNDKDGKRNLSSKLRVSDKNKKSALENGEEQAAGGSGATRGEDVVSGSYREQMDLFKLQRLMREEEIEALREEREARKREREERREEEERQLKLLSLQLEMKKLETQPPPATPKKVTLMKMRDMRENEDIDDFFRVFEMTAKSQHIPKEEWIGSLIPRLSERAKSVYLEIKDPEAQDYDQAKLAILESYQLTVDHYRYKFRHSEKSFNEDFVQWARRTRRYLDRWMLVAKATDNAECILEQITIERLLDAVGPELRAWLKEKKPETAEELAKIANEHVQARKGPLIDGKYTEKNKPKRANVVSEQPRGNDNNTVQKPSTPLKEEKKTTNFRGKCYKCQQTGHISLHCPNNKPATQQKPQSGHSSGYLCLSPLKEESDFSEYIIPGEIEGCPVKMLLDTGFSRTLVHRKFSSVLRPGSLLI